MMGKESEGKTNPLRLLIKPPLNYQLPHLNKPLRQCLFNGNTPTLVLGCNSIIIDGKVVFSQTN